MNIPFHNYVMQYEYPEAKKAGKKILAAEMSKTDREALGALFEGIPDPVDAENEEAWEQALEECLQLLAFTERKEDPRIQGNRLVQERSEQITKIKLDAFISP